MFGLYHFLLIGDSNPNAGSACPPKIDLIMLGRSMLNQDFYQAFFLGHFVVLVQPADAGETTAWFVEQASSEPVRRAFLDCLKGLSSPG